MQSAALAVAALAAWSPARATAQQVSPLIDPTVRARMQAVVDRLDHADLAEATSAFEELVVTARSFEPGVDDYVAQVRSEVEALALDRAQTFAEQGVQRFPESLRARALLLHVLQQRGDLAEAQDVVRDCLELGFEVREPANAEELSAIEAEEQDTAITLFRFFEAIDDYRGAVELFAALARTAPRNQFVWMYQGLAQFELANWSAAADAMGQALQISPELWPVELHQKHVFAIRKAHGAEEALLRYSELRTLGDDDSDSDLLYASLLIEDGKLEEAYVVLCEFRDARDLPLPSLSLYASIVELLAEAIPTSERELSSGGRPVTGPDLHLWAAREYERVAARLGDGSGSEGLASLIAQGRNLALGGNLDEAIELLERARVLHQRTQASEPIAVSYELARAYHLAGRATEAERLVLILQHYMEYAGYEPDRDVLRMLAEIYVRRGEHRRASEALARLLEQTGEDDVRADLVEELAALGEWSDAMYHARHLLRSPEHGISARRSLAEGELVANSSPGRAIETLQPLLGTPDWSTESALLLARARTRLREYDEALRLVRGAGSTSEWETSAALVQLEAELLGYLGRFAEGRKVLAPSLVASDVDVRATAGFAFADLHRLEAENSTGELRIERLRDAFAGYTQVAALPTEHTELLGRARFHQGQVQAELDELLAQLELGRQRARLAIVALSIALLFAIPIALFWGRIQQDRPLRVFAAVRKFEEDLKQRIRERVRSSHGGSFDFLRDRRYASRIDGGALERKAQGKRDEGDSIQDLLDVTNFGHLVAIVDVGWRELGFEEHARGRRQLTVTALSFLADWRNAVAHAKELDELQGSGRALGRARRRRSGQMDQVQYILKLAREHLGLQAGAVRTPAPRTDGAGGATHLVEVAALPVVDGVLQPTPADVRRAPGGARATRDESGPRSDAAPASLGKPARGRPTAEDGHGPP